jgi:hypothetical protein
MKFFMMFCKREVNIMTHIYLGIVSSANLWATTNDIENFNHGLEKRLHKKEGWLWDRLIMEGLGLVSDTQESLRERCFHAYQAQKIFIMAQKELMPPGWDPIDPYKSVKRTKGDRKFASLQRGKNPVPENIFTASFLRYAYGVKKETFRRWMGHGVKYQERIPVNKGKCIIQDVEFAKSYFTPKRLFMQHEMQEYMLSPDDKNGSKLEKKKHREFLKEHFKVLPRDILAVYEKACRERMAYQGFIEEAIVDTLNDNNEQAFRQLNKVQSFIYMSLSCNRPNAMSLVINKACDWMV